MNRSWLLRVMGFELYCVRELVGLARALNDVRIDVSQR
jgi:hypothetical protein